MINPEEILKNRGYSKSKKLQLLEEYFPEDFKEISEFASTYESIRYCFLNNIKQQPICQLEECSNLITPNKDGSFPKGCCPQHSQMITSLEKYGTTNPMKNQEVKEKLKETNLKKYGVDNIAKTKEFKEFIKEHNPMKNQEVKEKLKETNLKKYGVDNPMKNEEIKKKVSETHKRISKDYQEKVKETNLKKYGVSNPLSNPEIHKKTVLTKRFNNYYNRILKFPDVEPLFTLEEYHGSDEYRWKCNTCGNEFSFRIEDGKIPICRKCNPYQKNPFSKGEKEIVTWLKSILPEEVEIIENDRKILNGKELNILIPEKNLAIEFNGLYWHSELQGKDRNYHLNKTEQCKEKGIHLIHILDVDWYFKKEIIKSIIRMNLGLVENKIYARKTTIGEVSSKQADEFLENNHLQGKDNSSIRLGLFYNDELVSLMTFGKSRFNKNYQYEIYRFINKINTMVIGGASKLFRYFIENYNPESVITYSEKNYFKGGVYEKLGFQRLKDSPPNFYYFKEGDTRLFHRMKFQKHKQKELLEFFVPELTTWENMQINHYDRIWDAGNYVFSWKNVK